MSSPDNSGSGDPVSIDPGPDQDTGAESQAKTTVAGGEQRAGRPLWPSRPIFSVTLLWL